MNKLSLLKGSVTLALLSPLMALAQLTEGNAGEFGTFLEGVADLINNFLIPLLIALAVLVFIYGVFKYFIQGGADDDSRAQGRNLMLWAIIGFVAIVALWAIVEFVAAAFGFDPGEGPLDAPMGPDVG